MLSNKIIEIFVTVDDFCKEFDVEIKKHQLDAFYIANILGKRLSIPGMLRVPASMRKS